MSVDIANSDANSRPRPPTGRDALSTLPIPWKYGLG